MFADYKILVMRDYQHKRIANTLPPALVRPSPARLRAACLLICEDRFSPRDLPTLRTFFGPCNDKPTCLEAISRYDTGKFKALGKFLKGETTTPDDKIVELLAWLIDFTPRPHEFGRIYSLDIHDDDDDEGGQNMSQQTENERGPERPKAKAVEPRRAGRVLVIALSILIIGGAVIWLVDRIFAAPHACMYWSGDHYQPIPCNQHPDNALVIPLDSEKIIHFRKITRPDTITENALGSIWYARYHNGYECYTGPGYHPIDTNLRLRPLNDYVLLRYIRPGLQPARLIIRQ